MEWFNVGAAKPTAAVITHFGNPDQSTSPPATSRVSRISTMASLKAHQHRDAMVASFREKRLHQEDRRASFAPFENFELLFVKKDCGEGKRRYLQHRFKAATEPGNVFFPHFQITAWFSTSRHQVPKI